MKARLLLCQFFNDRQAQAKAGEFAREFSLSQRRQHLRGAEAFRTIHHQHDNSLQ